MNAFLQSTDIIDWKHPDILARAATSNAASLRVLQKCGFEVVRIQVTPADGRYPEREDAVLVLRQ